MFPQNKVVAEVNIQRTETAAIFPELGETPAIFPELRETAITKAPIVRHLDYFNVHHRQDEEKAKYNLCTELKRQPTAEEGKRKADEMNKESAALRAWIRDGVLEPLYVQNAQEKWKLEYLGHPVLNRREVSRAVRQMLQSGEEGSVDKTLKCVFDLKYSMWRSQEASFDIFEKLHERYNQIHGIVEDTTTRSKRKSNIVGIAHRVLVESFHRPLDKALQDAPQTVDSGDSIVYKVKINNPKRQFKQEHGTEEKKVTVSKRKKKFDPEVHVIKVVKGSNIAGESESLSEKSMPTKNAILEAIRAGIVSAEEISEAIGCPEIGVAIGLPGEETTKLDLDDENRKDEDSFEKAILGFVAITNTHNTSGDSAQRQSNGRDNIDTIEITDEITDNLVAELEAGPNTTAAETTSTSSIGKYCSCKNPLMTDLRYETESLCQYTHHHLKVKVGSLYGRKCFDCQGSLNEKIAGKMDFLHWCKNCILTDDDGDFLCNFVICPSCHEKRIGELGVQNDSEKRNSRRSRRTH